MIEILAAAAGLACALVADTAWWRGGIRKYERRHPLLIAHEHYHFGLELWIMAAVSAAWGGPAGLTWAIVGAGLGFILSEWAQHVEVAEEGVRPGRPWAWRSGHFRASTAIGLALIAVLTSALIFP